MSYTGQVKMFRDDFGFIALDPDQERPAGLHRDVFVHIQALLRFGV
jgi:cold shock CspA family protein